MYQREREREIMSNNTLQFRTEIHNGRVKKLPRGEEFGELGEPGD